MTPRDAAGVPVTEWNYADIWEAITELQPGADALVQGECRLSYAELNRRANGVARRLLDAGVARQDKVALYLHNAPEYLEATFAACKTSLVPVNTNYRYVRQELAYLWDNADATVVVFHGAFSEQAAAVRPSVPNVHLWLWVDDGSGPCPEWAEPYEAAAAAGTDDAPATPWGRSPDDVVMLYTGGTTGRPKGVQWRQDDLFARMQEAGFRRYPESDGLDGVRKSIAEDGPGMALLPACPLMHGTGYYTSLECLSEGGTVVLLTKRHLDPVEILDTVDREQVNGLVIVGDPFARPLLDELERAPERWKLTSLLAIISSGAMWTEEVKQGLLRHNPDMLLIDAFSSSEALGMAASVSSGQSARRTAEFTLGPDVRVIGTDGADVVPGSGEVGVLALGGRNPLGYYKDPGKSQATFPVINGRRFSVPGDFATVNADGSVHLLGRGSVSINTAGEKVFPEEVEEALKTHPAVRDAVVVGVPNPQFGEEVIGVVELEPGGAAGGGDGADGGGGSVSSVAEDELIAHVKGSLASFKAPKRVRVVASVGRSPSGKVDYGRHRREAAEWLGAASA